MKKITRKLLFFFFLITFLITAPTIVLYFQGYRFDLANKKLTQTGGLFLKVYPKQTEVYIDGKLAKKTDFFFGSAFIENLLPKKHQIEIKKEGYFTWIKNLEIKEKEVTKIWTVILFPEKTGFKVLDESVERFWFSPDGKKIILYEKKGSDWVLKLYDLEKNLKSHLIEGKNIYSEETDLIKLDFASDSKVIFLEIGMKETLKYFTLEIDRVPPRLYETPKIEPASKDVVTSQIDGKDTYFLDKMGSLFKNGEKISEIPFPVKSETEYKLNIFSPYIFLTEDKNLYLFNPELNSFEKFFENLKSLKISPNYQKLVYFSDWEIWVLFLRDKLEEPTKKAGEKLLITRLSEKIRDVFWLESDYLIFNAGNMIKIIEVDERDHPNMVDVPFEKNIEEGEIFWNQTDRKLYILNEGNLFASEELLR